MEDSPSVDVAHQLADSSHSEPGPGVDYARLRKDLIQEEREKLWDYAAYKRATKAEREAQKIIVRIREEERTDPSLFGNLPGEAVPDRKTHDMGGRFLRNKPRIEEKSRLFEIAKQMPKGAHLHLHFNSGLQVEELLPHARELKKTMFIRSTRPLLDDIKAYDQCEIVFKVLPETQLKADIFSPDYNPDAKAEDSSPWMLWSKFRSDFASDSVAGKAVSRLKLDEDRLEPAERWAREKMCVSDQQVSDPHQTHNGIWACFNQDTRAFKGLLSYESIYRWYVEKLIDNMIEEKIMYAELRPMMLDKTIASDDGTELLNHEKQMTIICEVMKKRHFLLGELGHAHKFPFGIKIIYATPRSISRDKMEIELDDCLRLKQQFPNLIAGFDLVGAEDRPNNIHFYSEQLEAFQQECTDRGISIPFLFHAGETLLDTGGTGSTATSLKDSVGADPDESNLFDALLLHAPRIGHGYALLRHPWLLERMVKKNVCLELCPISNEILHLCGNVRQHPFSALLAQGIHCTLNADNPSLYRYVFLHARGRSHRRTTRLRLRLLIQGRQS